jgi:hypothetical protein
MASQDAERDDHPDIARARDDPRLTRGRGAPLGDFFEAGRARRLAMWGLSELADSVQRERDRGRDDEATRLAAEERAGLARAELDNGISVP